MATKDMPVGTQVIDDAYVIKRYTDTIKYYWGASSHNKKSYKFSRTLTIVLGALVTLISSLASASFIEDNTFWNIFFSILTPLLAVALTIIGGFSQSFHWGATWRDMIINAERLEAAKDKFLATKEEERDVRAELEILNSLIIEETGNFFKRVLDSEIKSHKQIDGGVG